MTKKEVLQKLTEDFPFLKLDAFPYEHVRDLLMYEIHEQLEKNPQTSFSDVLKEILEHKYSWFVREKGDLILEYEEHQGDYSPLHLNEISSDIEGYEKTIEVLKRIMKQLNMEIPE